MTSNNCPTSRHVICLAIIALIITDRFKPQRSVLHLLSKGDMAANGGYDDEENGIDHYRPMTSSSKKNLQLGQLGADSEFEGVQFGAHALTNAADDLDAPTIWTRVFNRENMRVLFWSTGTLIGSTMQNVYARRLQLARLLLLLRVMRARCSQLSRGIGHQNAALSVLRVLVNW